AIVNKAQSAIKAYVPMEAVELPLAKTPRLT
ncbi:MAG: hypothetical protein ACI9HK_005264, partial [Pirellulaceae bacterium]